MRAFSFWQNLVEWQYMMREKIKTEIQEIIKQYYHASDFSVAPPENPMHGDYSSNVAFIVIRKLASQTEEAVSKFRISEIPTPKIRTGGVLWNRIDGQTPFDYAQYLVKQFNKKINEQEITFLERTEVVEPGFINFWVKDEVLMRNLQNILTHPDAWGRSDIGKNKTVMVEYFQLNIAKRPHIGHIRSAIIGDALKRIFLSQGYHAVSDTHVGDWGTQFGILLLGYKEAGVNLHKQKVAEDPFGALEAIYLAENARIEGDPARRERAKQEFAKLEQGDSENRVLWQWLVGVSMEKLKISAEGLGLLPFEEHRGESFYEDKMESIVALALEKKVAKKTDDGAVIVDLTVEGLDEAVLIKSDGASTYLLRDLAAIKYRKEQWNFWKNLYVVDVRQSHHFRQVFRVAELLGFEGVGESEHVSYGFMKLPVGPMSTRAGNIISLDIVLTEAATRARKVIAEKNPDLKDADDVARMVGLGALKYFDLSHHRESDIVFSWDRALSFEGNTGPYLQYTHARLKSILRKVQNSNAEVQSIDGAVLDVLERKLALVISRFPEAISDALVIFSPHVLAGYLYDLAQAANEFYHSRPVMQEEDEQKRNLRLALVSTTSATIKQGLNLLGIDAPEKM